LNHPPSVALEARDVIAARLVAAIDYARQRLSDEYGEPALEIDAFEVVNGTVRLLFGLALPGPLARFFKCFERDAEVRTHMDEIGDTLPGVHDLVEDIVKHFVAD
jgi:hypothetical protein